MKSETPAEGILRTNDFGSSKWYKVTCSCGQPDHDVDFEVEADTTGVTVNTYITSKSDHWSEAVKTRYDIDNHIYQNIHWFFVEVFNDWVRRFKLIWSILTKGYIKYEASVIMTQQQALNYAETLKSAVKDVEDFRKKESSKKENTSAIKEASQQDCV